MSNASSNAKRAPELRTDAERKADSDVSGQRLAMQHTDYAGLNSLGSEAFRVPVPPAPQSEPPRFSSRLRIGLYVFGAAVGVSAAAIGVALVLVAKPAEPSKLRTTSAPLVEAQAALGSVVEDTPAARAPEPTTVTNAIVEPPAPEASPAVAEQAVPAAAVAPTAAAAPVASAESEAKSASSSTRTRADRGSRARKRQDAAPSARLSREQVISAMSRVQPAVAACFGSTHGSAMASITVVGRTGRVTTAQVKGQSGSIGSCIARAVRGANFPRFTDESLTVSYPFAH